MNVIHCLVFLLLHPVHATLAEIEWNQENQRLEVALRLDVLDEQWLAHRLHDKARPASAKGEWQLDYLRSHFRIAALPEKGQADTTKYRWVGRQVEGSHVWWYFEISLKAHEQHVSHPEFLDVRLLQKRENDYTHRIVILGQSPPQSVTLNSKRTRTHFTADADGSQLVPARTDQRQ